MFVTGVGETTIGEQLKMNKGDKKDLWVRVETYPKTGKPNKGDWLDSPSYPFILNYEGEITTPEKTAVTSPDSWPIWEKEVTTICTSIIECKAKIDKIFIDGVFKKKI